MYVAGTYSVIWEDHQGIHRSPVFNTEQDARDFGNRLWLNSMVFSIEIYRRQFYKKRRNSVVIAKAERAKGGLKHV